MIKKYSVGIVLAFALIIIHLLYTGFINQHLIRDFAGRETKFLISRIIMWVILFIVFLYAKKIEKQSISLWIEKKYSLKFYLKSIPIVYFLAVGGAGVASVVIHLLTKEGVSNKIFEATNIFKNSYYLLILTCITAAVTEEYIMRGYIQTRLTKIYNNQWIGIFISSILFGILHSTYGTITQVVGTLIIGLVFAYHYNKYQSIKTLIIVHFLIDFISLNALYFK